MKIYQILMDGAEGGYLQAQHKEAALTEAREITKGWGKEYGPRPPMWVLDAKEMYLWDVKFYMGTTLEDMTVGAALGVLAYDEADVRRRAPHGCDVYEVRKSRKVV